MPCSNILPVYSNKYKRSFYKTCGVCQSCKIRDTMFYSALCEYEHKKHGVASFLTLTYDDFHISDLLRFNQNNEQVATLSRFHFGSFLQDLKYYLNYNNLFNPENLHKDFSYLYVGEYGGNGQKFDRPHFHALLFGLDHVVLKKIIPLIWQNGIYTSDPILNGGIRYVLKYVEKNLKGQLAKMIYDDNNIERPFMRHSNYFGQELINQANDKNNYTIPYKNNTRISLSGYHLQKLGVSPTPDDSYLKHISISNSYPFDSQNLTVEQKNYIKLNEYIKKEKSIIQSVRDNSTASLDLYDYYPNYEKQLEYFYERALLSDIPF